MSSTKKMPPNWYSSMKKKEKDSDNFWHRKFTLKVRNWHFLIAWFWADVDLTKKIFYEKVLIITQLSQGLLNRWTSQYHWVITSGWLERIMNILQIFNKTFSVHFYEQYSIDSVANFDIGTVLGQNWANSGSCSILRLL